MTLAASMSLRCATGSHGDAPRCCAKNPLEVGVALLQHAAIVGSAGAGAELGDEAAVAGEVLGGREAVDGAELTMNDDGQDLGRSRHRLDELDGWRGLDAIEDPVFQLLDMVGEGVQDLELLEDAAPGFIGKLLQCGFELWAPLRGKDVAGSVEGEGVLPGTARHTVPVSCREGRCGQGGMHAVLPEGHRDDVSMVRVLESAIRVWGSSRSSRTSAGGIQTEGSLPR